MYSTEITENQFVKLAKIIYDVAGINITANKKNLLKARLAKRLRATNIVSVQDYLQCIQKDPEEFESFIDGITTNHTFFFRENKHCEYLIQHLDKAKYYRIWSAASSSGEEPYTIAMQLAENGFRFDIFASDISESMLTLAKRGIYPLSKTHSVPHYMLQKYFMKGINTMQDQVKVRDSVKKYVTFEKHNLVTDIQQDTFDIIFCRNVMIYFDNVTKQKVVNDIYSSLVPGGLFIFGQSESLVGIETKFKPVIPSVYTR